MIFLRLLADYLLIHFTMFTNFRKSGVRYERVHCERSYQKVANLLPPLRLPYLCVGLTFYDTQNVYFYIIIGAYREINVPFTNLRCIELTTKRSQTIYLRKKDVTMKDIQSLWHGARLLGYCLSWQSCSQRRMHDYAGEGNFAAEGDGEPRE